MFPAEEAAWEAGQAVHCALLQWVSLSSGRPDLFLYETQGLSGPLLREAFEVWR